MFDKEDRSRTRILIVEDEHIVAADLGDKLERLGYGIAGTAHRASDAIRLAEASRPELVLMDISLPGGVDGISVATEIRRRWNIPVVFVTGNKDEAVIARAKTANPFGYVTKPFRLEELKATVAFALHQHSFTQHLFEEQAWLSTMLRAIYDGVIATDADGRVRYMNSAAETLTGWMVPKAFGREIEEVLKLFTAEGERVVRCLLRQALESGKPVQRTQFTLETLSGRRLIIEDTSAPIVNSEGRLAGAVTVFHDISARTLAEQEREHLLTELSRSNAELARFAYSVAHDLNEPARTFGSLTELLDRKLAVRGDASEKQLLHMMAEAADNMQRLIASLLGYAQVGEGELHRARVDLQQVLEAVRINLASALNDTGATLSCGDLPAVHADRIQMQRVFQNLIANAIRYTQPGIKPVIHVGGSAVEGGWRIFVSDNGVGIPPHGLEKIFEPLHRLHGKEISGTGLGLAMCRMILNRHGGRIWAESAGLNQGSTFFVFLPLT